MSGNTRQNKRLKETNKTVQDIEAINIIQTKGSQETEIIGRQTTATEESIASRKQEMAERILCSAYNKYYIFCL